MYYGELKKKLILIIFNIIKVPSDFVCEIFFLLYLS